MDYQVYMGSSMTVLLLAGCHYTCTLINWSVLRQERRFRGSAMAGGVWRSPIWRSSVQNDEWRVGKDEDLTVSR